MKNTFKAKVAAVVVMGLLVGVQANAAIDIKTISEVEFSKKCHEANGSLSREGETVYIVTCRSLSKKSELFGAYFPEQSYFLNGGDSAFFEKSLRSWDRK